MNFNDFAYKRRSSKILGSSKPSRTSESCINGFKTKDRNILPKRNANQSCIVIEDERGCDVTSGLPSSSKECIYVSSDSDLEREVSKPISSMNYSIKSGSEDITNEIEGKRTCVGNPCNPYGNASELGKKTSDINGEKSPKSLEFESKMSKLKQLFPKAKEERLKSFLNHDYDLPTIIHVLSWLYNGDEGRQINEARFWGILQ